MKMIVTLSAVLALGLSFMNANAADIARGKKLHDAKCMGCHDTRQYTRPNRIIHTLEDLHARVQFCDTASNAGFSLEDIDDVVAYLNQNFYKFK
jgi:cytochrome c2